jgi:cobalamin biosynthesis protein CobT
MAQALWYVAAKLLAAREERRIVLLLTDGQPDDRPETERLLRLCADAAIETVGIGIQVDVSHLFPVAVRVYALSDLKHALFGVAERLLVAA